MLPTTSTIIKHIVFSFLLLPFSRTLITHESTFLLALSILLTCRLSTKKSQKSVKTSPQVNRIALASSRLSVSTQQVFNNLLPYVACADVKQITTLLQARTNAQARLNVFINRQQTFHLKSKTLQQSKSGTSSRIVCSASSCLVQFSHKCLNAKTSHYF